MSKIELRFLIFPITTCHSMLPAVSARCCRRHVPADTVTGSLPDYTLMGRTFPLSEKTSSHQLQTAAPATYMLTLHERGLKCPSLSLKLEVLMSVEAKQKHCVAAFTRAENTYLLFTSNFILSKWPVQTFVSRIYYSKDLLYQ